MLLPEDVVPVDSSGLVLPSDRYALVASSQTQEYGRGDTFVDVLDIAFTVTGREGVFTMQVPLRGFAVFEYGIDLTSDADIIDRLYSL